MNNIKTSKQESDSLSETRRTEVLGSLIMAECCFRFNEKRGGRLYDVYRYLVVYSDYGSVIKVKDTKVSICEVLGLKSPVYDKYITRLKRMGLIRSNGRRLLMVGFEGCDTKVEYKKLEIRTKPVPNLSCSKE